MSVFSGHAKTVILAGTTGNGIAIQATSTAAST
jgi:hypothetical protein